MSTVPKGDWPRCGGDGSLTDEERQAAAKAAAKAKIAAKAAAKAKAASGDEAGAEAAPTATKAAKTDKPARPAKGKAKVEEAPKELSAPQKHLIQRLQTAFPGVDFQQRVNPDDELAITVPAAQWLEVGGFLRDQASFNYLRSVSGVDWKDRLACVYHLIHVSLPTRTWTAPPGLLRLAVHVDADHDAPELPSVYDLWPTADYQEREIFDMFGIRFTGHPNLSTLLLPPDWQGGYPLRKDFVDKRPKRPRLVRPR